VAALHGESVSAIRLSEVLRERLDGPERFDELFGLLQDHAAAGSVLAARLVLSEQLAAEIWLVEPVAPPTPSPVPEPSTGNEQITADPSASLQVMSSG
jgi:hypothetical protein